METDIKDGGNLKCCANCAHYEERTHFCRANPPQPMLFQGQGGSQNVSSKFPVVTMPQTDYCRLFEPGVVDE